MNTPVKMKLRSRSQRIRGTRQISKRETEVCKQKTYNKSGSMLRKISSYFKDTSVTVKKRSFSFSFSMQSRPRKFPENRCVSCVELNISRNCTASISTINNNTNRKIVSPEFDEITISKLMMKQNLVEKSLGAIILEAKQELTKEEHCMSEYVVMNVANYQQNYSSVESHHYEPMYGRKLLA